MNRNRKQTRARRVNHKKPSAGQRRGVPLFILHPSSIILLFVVCLTSGCALYRNDACFVPEEQYKTARDMFIATGSLDVVQRQLEAYEWRRCKINEIVYRLTKEFEVLPEELPTTNTTTTIRGQQ